MDEDSQEPQSKISVVEVVFVGLLLFGCDILDFIPFAGDVLDVIVGFPLQVYLYFKGVRGVFVFCSNAVEAIPGVQEFPFTRSIGWWTTVAFEHSASQSEIGRKLAGVVETVGNFEEGGGEGEAAGAAAETETVATEGSATAGEVGGKTGKLSGESERPSEVSTERKAEIGRRSETPEAEGGLKKPEISDEALGEQPTEFEKMKKMFEETPREQKPAALEAENEEGAELEEEKRQEKTQIDFEKVRKVSDKIDAAKQRAAGERGERQEEENEMGEGEDEDLPMAA